jgi:hypothetical protein
MYFEFRIIWKCTRIRDVSDSLSRFKLFHCFDYLLFEYVLLFQFIEYFYLFLYCITIKPRGKCNQKCC